MKVYCQRIPRYTILKVYLEERGGLGIELLIKMHYSHQKQNTIEKNIFGRISNTALTLYVYILLNIFFYLSYACLTDRFDYIHVYIGLIIICGRVLFPFVLEQ